MKSVTVYDPYTGQKLYKVSHTPKGYFAEGMDSLVPFDCKIITENNERITIPVRPK